MDKPEKRVITKLFKLPLSKLLDLKEISELPPDQYKITKNILFYLKQQETKKIQEFLGQDPKNTKGNYPNNANSFHDHFNMYFDHIRSHAKLAAGGGAIAIGKTTFFRKLKEYLMRLRYQTFLPQEVTLEHKSLLSLMYSNMDKYSFMFQQFVIQQFEINYRKIKQLETEEKIGPNTWILFDRFKNDFWPFT
ncbi:hypothetical protein C2G38_2320656 [Gigaspora rosea]|uniref:Deoxynucleoside kinase domain-containing protein n=1 Tax=Gigaspora rosea TaxID=44941 RepID=A0A397UXW4_9GLOM|nr:hypothetical protein C2G38_2320656 [Gigaspora rosea]